MFSFSGQIYIRKKIAKYIDGQFSKWGGVEGRATSDSDSTLDGFGKLKGMAPFRTKLHESDDRTLFYIKEKQWTWNESKKSNETENLGFGLVRYGMHAWSERGYNSNGQFLRLFLSIFSWTNTLLLISYIVTYNWGSCIGYGYVYTVLHCWNDSIFIYYVISISAFQGSVWNCMFHYRIAV